MTEDEAHERLNLLRERAAAEKATRAAFKTRRDAGLAIRNANRLRRAIERRDQAVDGR